MKIGILTYHQADNLGAVMQAYALSKYLQKEGHEAEVIDYRCFAIECHYDIFNPRILLSRKNVFQSITEYFGRFKMLNEHIRKHRLFKEFRTKNISMSKRMSSIKKPLTYDIIITGSDQVWNFHLNKGSENIYLLDFPTLNKTKKISYAASSEKNGFSRLSMEYIGKCLDHYNRISVRESFIKDFLSKYTQNEIQECLDPVFLLGKKDYLKLTGGETGNKYVVVFHMTQIPEISAKAKEIAQKEGLKLVEICGGFNKQYKSDWGPLELLEYLANAKYVFTTSFHGLALSLILEKNVWVINKGDNIRQKHLLSLAGLEGHLISNVNDFNLDSIDFAQVNNNLAPHILKSKSFLDIL